MTKSNQTYIVSPETARMIALGHPWVVVDSYTKRWKSIQAGTVGHLCDVNGYFIGTALLDTENRIAARILDHKPVSLNSDWLKKRLKAALNLRQKHAGISNDTTAYRIINAEGDGLPGLTVDRYGEYLMIQLYSEAWRPHLHLVTDVLNSLLKPTGVYEKKRPHKTRGLEAESDNKNYGKLLVGQPAPKQLEVLENGIKFLVSLEQGLNTGLFLDQRQNRGELIGKVAGKRVLNLFSYTGAFSVTAASGGASEVTSIDASPSYTKWCKENFRINRIDPGKHRFIIGDCLKQLQILKDSNSKYDIIIMDPPSFSTTSKSRFTTRGGTSDLVAAAMPLLLNGGLLITSSNHQKIDLADYLKELRRGALEGGCELRVISQTGQSGDFPYPVTFPEGRYLKYIISVKAE